MTWLLRRRLSVTFLSEKRDVVTIPYFSVADSYVGQIRSQFHDVDLLGQVLQFPDLYDVHDLFTRVDSNQELIWV